MVDSVNMTDFEKMRKKLSPQGVYRRNDFTGLSSNVDRYLKKLVSQKALVKIQNGLYMCPKQTVFGTAFPEEKQLLRVFLKDEHFVVYNFSLFNGLGLGLTQLYNKRVVFNRKRHGDFRFKGRWYHFYRWREAPKKLSKEFLYVEFLNRFEQLAEDRPKAMSMLKKQIKKLNQKNLKKAIKSYGKESSKKKLKLILSE